MAATVRGLLAKIRKSDRLCEELAGVKRELRVLAYMTGRTPPKDSWQPRLQRIVESAAAESSGPTSDSAIYEATKELYKALYQGLILNTIKARQARLFPPRVDGRAAAFVAMGTQRTPKEEVILPRATALEMSRLDLSPDSPPPSYKGVEVREILIQPGRQWSDRRRSLPVWLRSRAPFTERELVAEVERRHTPLGGMTYRDAEAALELMDAAANFHDLRTKGRKKWKQPGGRTKSRTPTLLVPERVAEFLKIYAASYKPTTAQAKVLDAARRGESISRKEMLRAYRQLVRVAEKGKSKRAALAQSIAEEIGTKLGEMHRHFWFDGHGSTGLQDLVEAKRE